MFVFLISIVFLVMVNMFSSKPTNLGLRDGRLAPCPSSPNCVSTQAEDEPHRVEPIAYTGSTESAMTAIKAVLAEMPRIAIVAEEGNYLHAEATSKILRFVDDIEFFVDEENGVIHFRSASRVGYSDLGANRSRMEQFRSLFQTENG